MRYFILTEIVRMELKRTLFTVPTTFNLETYKFNDWKLMRYFILIEIVFMELKRTPFNVPTAFSLVY